ncbi:MAG TPA: uracil-DNA glycosylase [Chloroflexi bacterium]|nr:uracil-DNA glycosylase [Chloroflexota bacterium]
MHDTWEQLTHDIITCRRCPRLVGWREEVARIKRRAYKDWTYWGKPVPGFGDRAARLLIIGLAPGAHGANRTGRMFTGDSSGNTLFAALHRAGFANQPGSHTRDDGLQLYDTFISAVVRCVPPKNRPTADEIAQCQPFLAREIGLLSNLQVVLALGRTAFQGYLRLLKASGYRGSRLSFQHGLEVQLPSPLPTLFASYHPSQRNTQTGLLTPEMLDELLERIRHTLKKSGRRP